MRSRNARSLNGGGTRAPSASPKKVPKRPSASTTPIVQPPTRSKGRSAGATGRSGMRAAVDSQGPEREVVGVEVVLEIEDPRESGSVPVGVLPRDVVPLRPQQIVDATPDGGAAGAPGGEEAEQCPRGLARRRVAHAGELVIVVALAGLAPAAVLVLVTLEPPHRALDVFVPRVLADGGKAAQHRPGAVDVVHAPAPVPRPVVPLRVANEVDRPLGGLEILLVAERAEQLEPAAGQVLGGGIEERAVIGERDVVQVETVVVGVERRPAAVTALHAEEPAEAELLGRP